MGAPSHPLDSQTVRGLGPHGWQPAAPALPSAVTRARTLRTSVTTQAGLWLSQLSRLPWGGMDMEVTEGLPHHPAPWLPAECL